MRRNPEHEELPERSRVDARFGEQGLAIPTYGEDLDEPHRGMAVVDVTHPEQIPTGSPEARSPSQPPSRWPAQWRRSDARVFEDVCESLIVSGIDATEIEVRIEDGVVWLDGVVPDREQKRVAEELAMDVRGVLDVINRLHVVPTDEE